MHRNNVGTRQEDWNDFNGELTISEADPFAIQIKLASNGFSMEEDASLSPREVYEHLRQIIIELGYVVVQLMEECTKESCPDLNVPGGNYLCAAHATPSQCCALDYIVHTLDGAAALLVSPKHFPSRTHVSEDALRLLQNLSRRVYRIFAHIYFSHREIFLQESKLYDRFMKVCQSRELLPASAIVIPKISTE